MDRNQQGNSNMERAKRFLGLTPDESEAVSGLAVPERAAGARKCFYDAVAVAGIRVDRVEPGLVVCSFKVPPRLTDRSGNLANGAIANLVDLVGISLEFGEGVGSVSTDTSISYLSTAKIDDELEITSKRLGRRGGYTGILIVLRNKTTGEITAEGRHSLLRSSRASKL